MTVQGEGYLCRWQFSVRGRGVSLIVCRSRTRCVSDSVQCEGEMCQSVQFEG